MITHDCSQILVIELIITCVAILPVQKTWLAPVVLSLFPLSIVLVASLEALGFD